jgi:hypothetical protein
MRSCGTDPRRGSRAIAWRITAFAIGLALLAGGDLAAKGGPKSKQIVAITFHDLVGDAIQSDGMGSYEGTIESDGSLLLQARGKRSIYFDFNDCVPPPPGYFGGGCYSPFGSDGGAGEISDVTLTITGLPGEGESSAEAVAVFDFIEGGLKWRIWFTVVATRTEDGNGNVSYSVRRDDTFPVTPAYWSARGIGPGWYGGGGGWFLMPWGADASSP